MKLRTKILLSMALVTSSLTAASLFIVRYSMGVHAREEILASFQNSSVTLHDFQKRKDTQLQQSAQLMADTPILKAVMTTRDPATIQDTSGSLWENAVSDLLVIADASGKVMALHNNGVTLTDNAVTATLIDQKAGDWWTIGNRVFRVTRTPISAGGTTDSVPLGTLYAGYEINPTVAHEMAGISSGEVAFHREGRLITSTLGPEQQQSLIDTGLGATGGITELKLAGERYLINAIELSPSPTCPKLMVLRSYDQATRFVQQLNRLILIVGIILIVVGAVVVFFMSRTFTHPLEELLLGVRELAGGNFAFPLRTKRGRKKDEIAELTSSFDQMRTSLKESQDRVVTSARMEAVGQLAGGVAHDFNNLITVIKGYADLLACQINPEDPLMKYAEQISKAGDRASSLTRQLLAFSRKQSTEKQPSDLNAIVNNLLKMLKVLIGERFELTSSLGTKMARVMVDPSQVEQVVLNLVVNARDAMDVGGPIEISTEMVDLNDQAAVKFAVAAGRYLRLAVKDSGCGMDEETQGKIFQPFFTTKEVGKGTGLGLAIVYSAAKQNGGFVDVQSALGKGSTFSVYIPELKSDVKLAEPAQPKAAPQRGTETILVVEDEDGVRNMIRDTLEMRGYRVLLATHGEEAMQMLSANSEPIDLVLSDVVMPKLGGVDLAVRLGANERRAKILLMSGYTERINEIENSKIPLLRKPFGPDLLLETIRKMLSDKSNPKLELKNEELTVIGKG